MRLIPFILVFAIACTTPEEPVAVVVDEPEVAVDEPVAVVVDEVVDEESVVEVTAQDTFLVALEACKADEACAVALEDMCKAL